MQFSVWPDLERNGKKLFFFIKNSWDKNIGVSPPHESTSLKFTKQDRAHILKNQFSSVFQFMTKQAQMFKVPKVTQ